MFDKKQVIRNILNSDENRLSYKQRSSIPFFLAILTGFIIIVLIMTKNDSPDTGKKQPENSSKIQQKSEMEDVQFIAIEGRSTTAPSSHLIDSVQLQNDNQSLNSQPSDARPQQDKNTTNETTSHDVDGLTAVGTSLDNARSTTKRNSSKEVTAVGKAITNRVSNVITAVAVPMDEVVGPEPSEAGQNQSGDTALTEDDNYFRDGLILAKAKDFLDGTNGKTKDYEDAIPLLLDIAGRGSTSAQFELAKLYRFGYGVEQNIDTAVSYYRKAANHGFGDAQCSLGALYYNGTGVAKSYTMAVLYFKKAADQGDRTGQFNLGCSYLDGTGVDKDNAEALKWFKMSAEQNYGPAIALLKKIGN